MDELLGKRIKHKSSGKVGTVVGWGGYHDEHIGSLRLIQWKTDCGFELLEMWQFDVVEEDEE